MFPADGVIVVACDTQERGRLFESLFCPFFRWNNLLSKANERREKLLKLQKHYQMVEDLFLLFAKKASEFNSWFENAEEDLTDPVRCNSVEQIKVRDIRKSVFFFQHPFVRFLIKKA